MHQKAMLTAFAACSMFSLTARADELFGKAAELRRMGLRPQALLTTLEATAEPAPAHSLAWPIRFADDHHQLGNNFLQFQEYGYGSPAYFHGGCDLRVRDGGEVKSPVAGRLEAGWYGYEYNPDGSTKKWFRPWQEGRGESEDLYFEVAVITAQGFRFEFHHVSPRTLPAGLRQKLQQARPEVAVGESLGFASHWPVAGVDGELYHHIHYNIVAPSDLRFNPEHFSELLPHTRGPVVEQVFALYPGQNEAESVAEPYLFDRQPRELVLNAYDEQLPNVYRQPPSSLKLSWNGGESGWDFTQTLSFKNAFPPIFEIFAKQVDLIGGDTLRTLGNYEDNVFLLRLPVPAAIRGPFTITVGDGALATVIKGQFRAAIP